MITKLKQWILGKVIVKKVMGKWVKHAAGALTGLILGVMSAPWFATHVSPVVEQIPQLKSLLSADGIESALMIILTGVFGAVWNYVEHRFVK